MIRCGFIRRASIRKVRVQMQLLFIRHGITDWNQQARIQGWTDIALNAAGRAQLAARILPPHWRDARCFTSTLTRCIETAQLLGVRDFSSVAELREMHWGRWEGQTLAELRQRDPQGLADNEARGLDFRPEEGESPRDVRERLNLWLAGLAHDPGRVLIITHKGVIRAALSQACDWDMRQDFSHRVEWTCGHEFSYTRTHGLVLERLNVSLQQPATGEVPAQQT